MIFQKFPCWKTRPDLSKISLINPQVFINFFNSPMSHQYFNSWLEA